MLWRSGTHKLQAPSRLSATRALHMRTLAAEATSAPSELDQQERALTKEASLLKKVEKKNINIQHRAKNPLPPHTSGLSPATVAKVVFQNPRPGQRLGKERYYSQRCLSQKGDLPRWSCACSLLQAYICTVDPHKHSQDASRSR